jgi:hypothetical protein
LWLRCNHNNRLLVLRDRLNGYDGRLRFTLTGILTFALVTVALIAAAALAAPAQTAPRVAQQTLETCATLAGGTDTGTTLAHCQFNVEVLEDTIKRLAHLISYTKSFHFQCRSHRSMISLQHNFSAKVYGCFMRSVYNISQPRFTFDRQAL